MKSDTVVKAIKTELLQTHLDGKLNSPELVLEIVRKHQHQFRNHKSGLAGGLLIHPRD